MKVTAGRSTSGFTCMNQTHRVVAWPNRKILVLNVQPLAVPNTGSTASFILVKERPKTVVLHSLFRHSAVHKAIQSSLQEHSKSKN